MNLKSVNLKSVNLKSVTLNSKQTRYILINIERRYIEEYNSKRI